VVQGSAAAALSPNGLITPVLVSLGFNPDFPNKLHKRKLVTYTETASTKAFRNVPTIKTRKSARWGRRLNEKRSDTLAKLGHQGGSVVSWREKPA